MFQNQDEYENHYLDNIVHNYILGHYEKKITEELPSALTIYKVTKTDIGKFPFIFSSCDYKTDNEDRLKQHIQTRHVSVRVNIQINKTKDETQSISCTLC